jgi:hypothetical protein
MCIFFVFGSPVNWLLIPPMVVDLFVTIFPFSGANALEITAPGWLLVSI